MALTDRMQSLATMLQGLVDPSSLGGTPSAPSAPTPLANPTAPPSSFVPTLGGVVPQTPGAPSPPQPPLNYTGRFGIHGAARDILGTLGDAFLAQAHEPDMYQPEIMRERQGQAMQGFVQNPLGSIQAMSKYDPAGAENMYNTYMTNSRLNRMADQQYSDLITSRVGGLLGAAKPDGSNWDAIRTQATAYAKARGMPIDIPEHYDPDFISQIQHQSITPEQELSAAAMASWRGTQAGLRQEGNDIRATHYDNQDDTAKVRTGISQQNADTRSAAQGTQAHHYQVTEGQGAAHLAEDARHHQVTEGQGSRNLDLHQQGQYYGSRRGIGGGTGAAGNIPTFSGPNDPNYAKAAPGTQFRRPGDPNVYTKGK